MKSGYFIITIYKSDGTICYKELNCSKPAARLKQKRLAKRSDIKEVTLSQQLLIYN